MNGRNRLYRWFLIMSVFAILWQLYELVQWRQTVASRHPGVIRPWQR
jgi:hypothetical protein